LRNHSLQASLPAILHQNRIS